MLVYFIILFLFLFLNFFQRTSSFDYEKNLKFIFSILAIYGAIRYQYGSDYMNYFAMYNTIQNSGYMSRDIEIGYIFLNKIVPNFFFIPALGSFLISYAYFKV